MLCALSAVMHPFVLLCNLISDGLMRLLGNDPKALDETVTEEEILHMVGEGEEKGVIEENERDMITNIFDFNDTTVTEIMTHRTDICAIDEESTIAQAAVLAVENCFSVSLSTAKTSIPSSASAMLRIFCPTSTSPYRISST